MKLCSICHKKIETEEPAILTMSGFGNPRHICNECEKDLDNATLSKDPEIISEAIEKIGKKIRNANNDDELVLETVTGIIENATERGEMIKNGVYDFENDEAEESELEDSVPEELLESEEDRELDKKEELTRANIDKIINYATLGIFVGVLGYIVYWIISRFF